MESAGAFVSVLLLLLSRGQRHGKRRKLRARQSREPPVPTPTRISRPHGEWRCWYARRLQPVHFPIERPQKRTGGSIQDQIVGSVPRHIRPGGMVGYAPNRRGRTLARDSSLRCHRSPTRRMKNPKHAGNEQLESNLSNLARINRPLTEAHARMRSPLQPTRPRI